MQESASFWTEIKSLEEQLAKSPNSFCFARLAEVHLKVGLVDDALHVARQGVLKHPGYLAGQRVLSQACYAKGLNDEALAALKLVAVAMPEDVASQKLLGHLLVEAGDQEAACQAFRAVLEFAPDDVECRIELDSLERSCCSGQSSLEEDDEMIIDDLEILEEPEILDESEQIDIEEFKSEYEYGGCAHETDTSEDLHDPLSTVTLAELYVSQGFTHKALEIFRTILSNNPADQAIAERIAALEALETAPQSHDPEIDDLFDEAHESSTAIDIPPEIPAEKLVTESDSVSVVETLPTFEIPTEHEAASCTVPSHGTADNALKTLDIWLENIRRIKSCL